VAESSSRVKLFPELSVHISGNDENGSEKMSALHSSRLAGDDSPVTKDSSEPKEFAIPLPKELEQEEELDSVSHEILLKGRDSSGKCSGAVSVLAMGAAMKELALFSDASTACSGSDAVFAGKSFFSAVTGRAALVLASRFSCKKRNDMRKMEQREGRWLLAAFSLAVESGTGSGRRLFERDGGRGQ
jgi:hypothetical protein